MRRRSGGGVCAGDRVLVLDACYPSYLGAMKVRRLQAAVRHSTELSPLTYTPPTHIMPAPAHHNGLAALPLVRGNPCMQVAGITPSFITQFDAQTGLPALDRITPEQLQG